MDTTLLCNAAALLIARGAPSRTALVCGEASLSYSELRVAVRTGPNSSSYRRSWPRL